MHFRNQFVYDSLGLHSGLDAKLQWFVSPSVFFVFLQGIRLSNVQLHPNTYSVNIIVQSLLCFQMINFNSLYKESVILALIDFLLCIFTTGLQKPGSVPLLESTTDRGVLQLMGDFIFERHNA